MAFQPMRNQSQIQSTLVIHQGALGDFILTLPALEILRKTFPQAKSMIMGYPRILELVEQRFYAEQVFSVDQRGMASFFVQGGRLDQDLSNFFSTFHLVVVFGRDGEGILTQNLKKICRGEIFHISSFPSSKEKIHVTDHLLQQFVQCGFPLTDSNPKLHLNQWDRDKGKDFWRRNGVTPKEREGVIVLHPGSGSKKKVWPLKRFLDLTCSLQLSLDSRILVVLGPAEDPEVRNTFEGMGPSAPICVNQMSLLQLASVMQGCRLFIGNDSGITHMAAALGIPTISIFGPTDPRMWAPKGEKVWVIQKGISCSPCVREQFLKCEGIECLKGIEVSEVLEILKEAGIRLKC